MKKRLRLKKWVVLVLIGICFAIFAYSFIKIIKWSVDVKENKDIQIELSKSIETKKEDENITYNIDFESLKKINPDTVGYIDVKNTNISYVVVKGKDNSYYLNHNFEKKSNVAGWIFADFKNKFNGNDKNIVIYGHNTRDNSMFGTLKKTLESEWYENEKNHIVTLVTEMGQYEYQVFSTYTIIPEEYYITTEFSNDDDFGRFVLELKSRSIYNYGVDVNKEDTILTLSSCISDGRKRVVLHAKKI